MSWPRRPRIYSGTSRTFGALVMPLRLSVLTRYWSITHSSAERLSRWCLNVSGRMPSSVRYSLWLSAALSLESFIFSTRQASLRFEFTRWNAHILEMLFNERKHVLGFYGCTQLLRPRSAGMNHIPHRFLALRSSTTRRIVA